MKFLNFIEEKIFFILFEVSFIFIISLFLIVNKINIYLILLFAFLLIIYVLGYLFLEYLKIKQKEKQIKKLIDDLEEKYLIIEILPKPKEIVNQAYYYSLKKACKAMNDKISNLESEQLDFKEYVESFGHEIKTPIAALSLLCDNNNLNEIKEELIKIDNLVEQMLYYERSDNPEKDYFIKEINIDNIIHSVLLNYKNYFLKYKITLDVKTNNEIIYTDEKWLIFIISQIIQNSIKYLDKKEKIISIETINNKNNVILSIKDNGIGIKEVDLPRIFDKGFTGANRKKEHSTGIGLYLTKKLCDRLGLNINLTSKENKFTKVEIIFPKTDIFKIE